MATNTNPNAVVTGHGGVGIVEEVGRLVRRVKAGDQVILATTPNCGVCQNCLSGRGDLCNTRLPAIPNATMSDRTPVYMDAPPVGPAGYSEFIVLDEDSSPRLIENGLFDAKSLVGQTFRVDKMREALQVAADRSSITSVIDFTSRGARTRESARITTSFTVP